MREYPVGLLNQRYLVVLVLVAFLVLLNQILVQPPLLRLTTDAPVISRSCQSDPMASWNSGPSANWPSSCSASRPASSRASTWPFSTAATPWRAWSGRWSCPQAAAPGSISSPACGATLGCTPCLCPRSGAQGEAGTAAQVG